MKRSFEFYRIPMVVCEIHLLKNGDAFSVCPNCHITLEREYQRFCDRCGQALDWRSFSKARVIRLP